MTTIVTWNEPRFKDNSNSPLLITCSHQSGATFYWGTWNVFCTAYDDNPDNDPAVCKFTITVKRKQQVDYPKIFKDLTLETQTNKQKAEHLKIAHQVPLSNLRTVPTKYKSF